MHALGISVDAPAAGGTTIGTAGADLVLGHDGADTLAGDMGSDLLGGTDVQITGINGRLVTRLEFDDVVFDQARASTRSPTAS